jgi:hypothetical protein
VDTPVLIFCGAGNRAFAETAIRHGFQYGAQLPDTVYFPPYFADQDWKDPQKGLYMAALEKHRPAIATVLDLEKEEQRDTVLAWAEEVAAYVTDSVLIIPKVNGIIAKLPRAIGGKRVRLAYSIPTKYGGTRVPAAEFYGWDLHLLGGSPHTQVRYWHHFKDAASVLSIDGNMAMKMATQFNRYWKNEKDPIKSDRWWPVDREIRTGRPLIAFDASCRNIMAMWQSHDFGDILSTRATKIV